MCDPHIEQCRNQPSGLGTSALTVTHRLAGNWHQIAFLISLYLIVVQELVATSLLQLHVPVEIIRVFMGMKEGIVLLAGALLAFRLVRYGAVRYLLLFFLYSTVFLFVTPIPISMALYDFRNYALVVASFIIGYAFAGSRLSFSAIASHVRILLWFIVLFAIVEHFIFPETMFRDYFPMVRLATDIKGFSDEEYFVDDLSANVITSDAGKRMLGPFGEPLYMGYFTIILVDILLVNHFVGTSRKRRVPWLAILGTAAVILTQVKAVWLGAIASVIYLLLGRKHGKLLLILTSLALVSVIAVSGFFRTVMATALELEEGSARGHYLAYFEGIPRVLANPLGNGIGTAGSISGRLVANVFAVENTYINRALEIGILGMLFVLGVSLYVVWKGKRFTYAPPPGIAENDLKMVFTAALLNVQFVVAGFLAPQTFTVRILIPLWFITGAGAAIIVKYANPNRPNQLQDHQAIPQRAR
jgi:hypothetical protein